MLISQNIATLNDNPVFGAPVEKSYVETRIDYSVNQQIPDDIGGTNAFISVYIQMDDTHKKTVR